MPIFVWRKQHIQKTWLCDNIFSMKLETGQRWICVSMHALLKNNLKSIIVVGLPWFFSICITYRLERKQCRVLVIFLWSHKPFLAPSLRSRHFLLVITERRVQEAWAQTISWMFLSSLSRILMKTTLLFLACSGFRMLLNCSKSPACPSFCHRNLPLPCKLLQTPWTYLLFVISGGLGD